MRDYYNIYEVILQGRILEFSQGAKWETGGARKWNASGVPNTNFASEPYYLIFVYILYSVGTCYFLHLVYVTS